MVSRRSGVASKGRRMNALVGYVMPLFFKFKANSSGLEDKATV